VKDIDVAANLPAAVKPGLATHLEAVRAQHTVDLRRIDIDGWTTVWRRLGRYTDLRSRMNGSS